MHEHQLTRELFPQMEQIAETRGFVKVTRMEMTVGSLHGVSGEFLEHSFQHAFEKTSFEGAEMRVTVVDPADKFSAPGQPEELTATGWELLITLIEGDRWGDEFQSDEEGSESSTGEGG